MPDFDPHSPRAATSGLALPARPQQIRPSALDEAAAKDPDVLDYFKRFVKDEPYLENGKLKFRSNQSAGSDVETIDKKFKALVFNGANADRDREIQTKISELKEKTDDFTGIVAEHAFLAVHAKRTAIQSRFRLIPTLVDDRAWKSFCDRIKTSPEQLKLSLDDQFSRSERLARLGAAVSQLWYFFKPETRSAVREVLGIAKTIEEAETGLDPYIYNTRPKR